MPATDKSKTEPPSPFLRRYTDLPALLYLLHRKMLTLLDSESWDDRNDSHYIHLYRSKKNLPCVLALCFTENDETYHDWRVFAPGSSGVCIKFDRERLLSQLSRFKGVRYSRTQYAVMKEFRKRAPPLEDLPFLKRHAFCAEAEFRIIYEDSAGSHERKDFAIDLGCVAGIAISPWVAEELARAVIDTIKGIEGCGDLDVRRSSLINDKEWKRLGAQAG